MSNVSVEGMGIVLKDIYLKDVPDQTFFSGKILIHEGLWFKNFIGVSQVWPLSDDEGTGWSSSDIENIFPCLQVEDYRPLDVHMQVKVK